MRILEAQSAVLSNYEVFQHLIDQRSRYKQQKRRGPPNLETVVTEVWHLFFSAHNPEMHNAFKGAVAHRFTAVLIASSCFSTCALTQVP